MQADIMLIEKNHKNQTCTQIPILTGTKTAGCNMKKKVDEFLPSPKGIGVGSTCGAVGPKDRGTHFREIIQFN